MTKEDACTILEVKPDADLIHIYKSYTEKHKLLRDELATTTLSKQKEELELKLKEMSTAFELLSQAFNFL